MLLHSLSKPLLSLFLSMEALYFLKFWSTTTPPTGKDNQISSENNDNIEIPNTRMDGEFDEGKNSFFGLELTAPDLTATTTTKITAY